MLSPWGGIPLLLLLKKCFVSVPGVGFAAVWAICFDSFQSAKVGVFWELHSGENI